MTIPPVLRSWRALVALGCLIVVGVAVAFLPSLLANPVDDPGAGPPDASVVPPFEEDTFAPVVAMSLPSGSTCAWLEDDAITGLVGQPLSAAPTTAGCTWSGSNIRIEVTTIDQPLTAAYPDFAEDWADYPEVVTDPVNGLFFLEGDEAALLLDAGESTVVIHTTRARGDRRLVLDRLVAMAELLAD